MTILPSLLTTWLAALLLCTWCGWGITRLLLPTALQPYRRALVPLIGYVVLIWAGYNAVHSWFSLRQALPLLLGITGIINAVALVPTWRRWRSGVSRRPAWHSLAHPLLPVLLVSLVVGVLPLLHYGYLTIIGNGWDGESYLALSGHLQDYRLAAIPLAPSSPLRNHVVDPPSLGLSMGLSIVQGLVGIITGQHSLQTFAPLLALMRMLGLVSVYVWLRAVMGLRRWPAIWATALTSTGALLLWVSYFNFGMQLAAWPLLALVLTLGVAAVEDAARRGPRAWPGILVAALSWAVVPMTYYPLLTVVVPMAVGLAGALLLTARYADMSPWQARGRMGVAILALGVCTALLSTWVTADYFAGFRYRYANALTTLGLFRFIPLSDILGWTAFDLNTESITPLRSWVTLALMGSALLCVAALVRGPHRIRWLFAVGGAAVYLLWVRYGREYHYAYMKGGSYVGFVAAGLLAAGWQGLLTIERRSWRIVSGGVMVILLLLAGTAQAVIIRDHWAAPKLALADIAALDRVADSLMPRTATVLVTSDQQLSGVPMSMIAAALYPRPMRGHLITAYSSMDETRAGEQPQFVLLAASERPAAKGLGEAAPIWGEGRLRLYAMPTSENTSLLMGRDDSGVLLGGGETIGILQRAWGGPYRLITPQSPLTLQTSDILGFGPAAVEVEPRGRLLTLDLATLTPTTLQIVMPTMTQTVTLEPGVSNVSWLQQVAQITLHADAPVAFLRARAVEAASQAVVDQNLAAARNPDWLVWQPTLTFQDGQLDLQSRFQSPIQRVVRAEVVIVGDSYKQPTQALNAVVGAPAASALRLAIDLAQGSAQAFADDTAVPLLNLVSQPASPAGTYLVAVSLLDSEERVARVPLGRITVGDDGRPTQLEPLPVTIETALLGPEAREQALYDVALGTEGSTLRTAQLSANSAPAGATLNAELVWQAGARPTTPPMVSVQVLGADDHKWAQWDGPLGGWYPATLWNQGEQIRQDVPLKLDPATPPGTYRVLLLVYDPANGQPILLNGQAGLELQQLEVR